MNRDLNINLNINIETPADPAAVTGGKTLLHVAAAGGYYQVVLDLLTQGADPNARDNRGMTPLHHAAWNGDTMTIGLISGMCEDVDVREDTMGMTPLHVAVAAGNYDAVMTLLLRGAHLEARDRDGRTPLHYAAKNRHLDIFKYLVDKGASISMEDDAGWPPLAYLTLDDSPEIFQYLNRSMTDRVMDSLMSWACPQALKPLAI